MSKAIIYSGSTAARVYEVEDRKTPMEIANELGRGESGEVINIYDDADNLLATVTWPIGSKQYVQKR